MGKIKYLSSRTSRGEEGLLESQTKCNIVSKRVNVSNCRWNGPKYDYGSKAMTSSERNRRPICEDPFVRYLVHGEGLYSNVWIDSHHKYDSNQVITSIMNVINDVRDCRGSFLPPVLCIQVDNCS